MQSFPGLTSAEPVSELQILGCTVGMVSTQLFANCVDYCHLTLVCVLSRTSSVPRLEAVYI